MTVVTRTLAATPARTASETWEQIVGLISEAGSPSRRELDSVSGIAASVIAEETPSQAPIVVAGNGPRLRVYCVYGEDAVLGEGCDENSLSWNPTEGDWKLYLPCPKEDLGWVGEALKRKSNHVVPYDLNKDLPRDEASEDAKRAASSLSVNLEEFLKK